MLMHLKFAFKWALHSRPLAVKLDNPFKYFASCTTCPLALCLTSNEGWLNHLLLQYKWIIQPNLSLLWL